MAPGTLRLFQSLTLKISPAIVKDKEFTRGFTTTLSLFKTPVLLLCLVAVFQGAGKFVN